MAIQRPTMRLPMEVEEQVRRRPRRQADDRELRASAPGDARHLALDHRDRRRESSPTWSWRSATSTRASRSSRSSALTTRRVTISDRMNYLSPLCNNVGLSCAVEHMMGIEVTPRCAAIRIVMYELSRIADHILGVGLQAMDLGAFSLMLWAFIEREKLYDIFENVTGARLTTSYTRVGGLSARRCPDDFVEQVRAFLVRSAYKHGARDGRTCSTRNKHLPRPHHRHPPRSARRSRPSSLGPHGPDAARDCGVPYDIRKNQALPRLRQATISRSSPRRAGDVWARYRVRVEEMYESFKIIEQVLKATSPRGRSRVTDPEDHHPAQERQEQPAKAAWKG